jgi:hypothetical protein
LRIFDTQSEFNTITCFTFLENNRIIKKCSDKYLESKFILSEDDHQIVILNQGGSINIIKVNDKHSFDIYEYKNNRVFEKLK